MRRPERETTALTAVLVAVAGLLILHFAPWTATTNGLLAATAALLVLAATAHATSISAPRLAAAVTVLYLHLLIVGIQTAVAALLHLLTTAERYLTPAPDATDTTRAKSFATAA